MSRIPPHQLLAFRADLERLRDTALGQISSGEVDCHERERWEEVMLALDGAHMQVVEIGTERINGTNAAEDSHAVVRDASTAQG